MAEGGRELSEVPFTRALIPLMSAVPLWPNRLPNALLPSTITLGGRFQHMNLGVGHKYSAYSTWLLLSVSKKFRINLSNSNKKVNK